MTTREGNPEDWVDVSADLRDAVSFEEAAKQMGPGPSRVDNGSTNPKRAHGDRKPSGMALIPGAALIFLGEVMMLGARKYGPMNWRKDAVDTTTYHAAIMRHLTAWADGEGCDAESGMPHLAHIMACCAIMLDAECVGKLVDQRVLGGPAAALLKTVQPVSRVALDTVSRGSADD